MNSDTNIWNKKELKTYILLLCANVDSLETEEDITYIKSKSDKETYTKMHTVFSNYTEEKSIEKILVQIKHLNYSPLELSVFKKEVFEIFYSDEIFSIREQILNRILNKILY